jgi:hypothetical protein
MSQHLPKKQSKMCWDNHASNKGIDIKILIKRVPTGNRSLLQAQTTVQIKTAVARKDKL